MNRKDREKEARGVVAHLQQLRNDPRDGNAAMAILRRGMSERAGDVEKMYRYLYPYLLTGEGPTARWQERCVLLIASLFALCKNAPETDEGNMGNHFAAARATAVSHESAERRFSSLIGAHHEDLPIYLRRAVTYLKADEIGINWARLLVDVQDWPDPQHGEIVRREWARCFWLTKSSDITSGGPL